MLEKYKDNKEYQARYHERFEERIAHYFPAQSRICDRYFKNHYKIDKKNYKKDRVKVVEETSDDVQILEDTGEEQKLPEKLPKINNPYTLESSANGPESAYIPPNEDKNEEDDNNNNKEVIIESSKPKVSSTLKPKNQIASVSHLKLPKIR
jgi:hypothetical protein